eukprot:scaffold368_cov258-Pinguiococcus_pyrenoidosus.AAC.67
MLENPPVVPFHRSTLVRDKSTTASRSPANRRRKGCVRRVFANLRKRKSLSLTICMRPSSSPRLAVKLPCERVVSRNSKAVNTTRILLVEASFWICISSLEGRDASASKARPARSISCTSR